MARVENSGRTLVEDFAHLQGSQTVGMFLQGPSAHGFADLSCKLCVNGLQQIGDDMTVVSDQDLAPGSKELFDARPVVSDETCSGAGGFKNPRRRRKTYTRHRFAI